MDIFLRALSRFICRRYRLTLLLLSFFTLLCVWPVWQLGHRLETDIAALLPSDYPSVRALQQIKEKVRGTESLVVLVECPDSSIARHFVEDLAAELGRERYARYIKYTTYRRDVDFFEKNALLYIDRADLSEIDERLSRFVEQKKEQSSPLYVQLDDDEPEEDLGLQEIRDRYAGTFSPRPYYANAEGTARTLTIAAAGTASNIGFGRALETAVKGAVEELQPGSYHAELQVYYGGSFRAKIAEYEVIREDIFSSLVYGLIGIVLLLTLYFRQPLAVLFVVIPLVMGLVWAFALTYWTIGNLNTITGFLFVVLFGLGIDFGIHLFARYMEYRVAGLSTEDAIEQMLTQTGRAMATAGATTVAAFYALTIADFKGFSEFGFIVGTGVITTMLAMVTVLPAGLLLVDRDWQALRLRPIWGQGGAKVRGRFPQAKLLLLLCAVVAGWALWHVADVDFEYDFSNLRADTGTDKALKEKIDSIVNGDGLSNSPSVVLADDEADLREVVLAVESLIAAPDPTPTIDAVRTLESALPKEQDEKLVIIARLRAQVEELDPYIEGEQRAEVEKMRPLLDVHKIGVEDLPQSLRRRFVGVDGELIPLAFIYPKVQLKDGLKAMAFADDCGLIHTAAGKNYYASSSGIVFADMLRVMLRDSRTAIAITILVVTLIALIDFRSIGDAALVLLPLACGIAWMLGAMYWVGLKFNFYNMVVVPSIVGMGIDNGVHLYHRYREEGRGSLPRVLRHTGGAMLACLLTTMVGFAGLTMARHPGLNSIGILALVGLSACFLASVIALPALLQVLEDWRHQSQIKK